MCSSAFPRPQNPHPLTDRHIACLRRRWNRGNPHCDLEEAASHLFTGDKTLIRREHVLSTYTTTGFTYKLYIATNATGKQTTLLAKLHVLDRVEN